MKKIQRILVVSCLAVSGLVFMAARGTETTSSEALTVNPVVGVAPSVEMVEAVAANEVSNSASATSAKETATTTSARELTMKEKIAARAAVKAMKKEMKVNEPSKTAAKSQLVALLLVIFLGYLGIHRFYLGYTGIGILMLLTGGLCGILVLIDFIRIIIGDLGPKGGSYDETL